MRVFSLANLTMAALTAAVRKNFCAFKAVLALSPFAAPSLLACSKWSKIFAALLLSHSLYADTYKFGSPRQEPSMPEQALPQEQKKSISREELLSNLPLLEQALQSAILTINLKAAAYLLPIYEEANGQNPELLGFARALAFIQNGDLKSCKIELKKLEHLPSASLLLNSLEVLNMEYISAKAGLAKALSDEDMPPFMQEWAKSLKEQMDKKQKVDFSLGLGLINDANINNAPDKRHYKGWTLNEKEKGQGFSYNARVSKDTAIMDNVFLRGVLSIQGRYLHKLSSYAYQNYKIDLGPGYENSFLSLYLLPTYSRFYYANSLYSKSHGLALDLKVKLYATVFGLFASRSEQRHKKLYSHKNGHKSQIALSVQQSLPHAIRLALNIEQSKEKTKAADEKWTRRGLRAVYSQGLGGFFWQAELGYGLKRYEKLGFFGVIPKIKDLSTLASIWHKNISYKGFMPRLVAEASKARSNDPRYLLSKKSIYLEITKEF